MHDSKYPQMKILETKRCILRPATLDDAFDLFQYYKQDIVVKYLPLNKHKSLNDTKRFIQIFFLHNYKQGKIGHFVVVFKKDKKVIGNVGFNNILKDALEGEIGICINPEYWGYNLSTELAIEMLRYGFEDLNLKKVIATTFDKNKYSKKTLENIGFYYTGEYKKKVNSLVQPKSVICHKYEMSQNSYMKNSYKINHKFY